MRGVARRDGARMEDEQGSGKARAAGPSGVQAKKRASKDPRECPQTGNSGTEHGEHSVIPFRNNGEAGRLEHRRDQAPQCAPFLLLEQAQ
jgi:hypothetical protein